MPDTRPGIKFDENGVCNPCLHYERSLSINWEQRWQQLEQLCDKHRGSNGDGYDCVIAVSGGKDSHYQTYIMKEKLKMNPLLVSVGNIDWTDTGRKNLQNLTDSFGCDLILYTPNSHVARIMAKKALIEIGSPGWYNDSLLYAFPIKMAMKFGIKLVVYGENVSYQYGGENDEETPSALHQIKNNVVKPEWDLWFKDGDLTKKDLEITKHPNLDEMKNFSLEPIYLSYYVHWNSIHNFQVAKKWGFQTIEHEYNIENSIEPFQQIDSLSYLLNPSLKYLKYGQSIVTDQASRLIRYGLKTRDEMIPIVEQYDGKIDQGTVEKFCEFIRISVPEFWKILDKWYNPKLFEKDHDGIWHPKFKVGSGLL